MKVLCINQDGWQDCETQKEDHGPAFKEICTVETTVVCECCGTLEYTLAGYPDQYEANQFIPLVDLEEMIEEEKEVELVTAIIKPIFSPVKLKA